MQKMSTTSPAAKSLVVFPVEFRSMILPEIQSLLTTPEQIIDDKIYAVIKCPKGRVSFRGSEFCDIKGA